MRDVLIVIWAKIKDIALELISKYKRYNNRITPTGKNTEQSIEMIGFRIIRTNNA